MRDTKTVKEALSKAVFGLASLIMGYYAFRLLFIGMLDFRELAYCCIVVTAMVLLGTVPRVSALSDPDEKREAVRRAVALLFAFYLIGLVGTLFVGRVAEDMTLAARRAYWAEHWKTQVNLTPLRTVRRYISALSRGVIPKTSLRNLVGNTVLMAPMSVLAPILFERLRKPWRFLLLTALILVSIEALQLTLCCGICDVDDVILNLFGAVAVYFVMRLPFIKKLLVRLYVLPPAETDAAVKSIDT